MNELLGNGIFQSVAAAVIIAGLTWLWKRHQFSQDETRIVAFLEDSESNTDNTFRSTHAIASGVNMTEERVRTVCGRSTRISRNQKERETWRLSD